MSELNKLELNWIDSSNEDQREHFLDALNSYLLFKKDSLDKCNLLIEENPNFNAPKLLKIILILLTRDNNKIIDAKILLGNINIENLNDHFKKYINVISFCNIILVFLSETILNLLFGCSINYFLANKVSPEIDL